jgi:hypothetical protein
MVEKIIKIMVDLIEALKLSDHLDKFVIAYMMYRQGRMRQSEIQLNEYLKLKEKYEKIKHRIKLDDEYKKQIEDYFNRNSEH